jgi:cell wall-associated NlpC family hydrolase
VSADPKKTSAQIEKEIEVLATKASIAVEDYNAAQVSLEETQERVRSAEAKIESAQADLARFTDVMSAFSAAAYRSGGFGDMVTLLTAEDGDAFMSRATTLGMLAERRTGQMRDLTAARNRLAQARKQADQDLQTQQRLEASLKARKGEIERMLAQQQALLSSVKAEERAEAARVAAAKRAQQLRLAQERAARAAAARQAQAATAAKGSKAPANISASGRASAAIAYAQRQIGKPYRWGGAGPNSFDCSGLTMRAWGAAGVSLAHSSRAQYSSGRKVSRNELQPGDLVFFGKPIHHVGIYVGGGMMIHAPQTGKNVTYASIGRGDYVGAIRP